MEKKEREREKTGNVKHGELNGGGSKIFNPFVTFCCYFDMSINKKS